MKHKHSNGGQCALLVYSAGQKYPRGLSDERFRKGSCEVRTWEIPIVIVQVANMGISTSWATLHIAGRHCQRGASLCHGDKTGPTRVAHQPCYKRERSALHLLVTLQHLFATPLVQAATVWIPTCVSRLAPLVPSLVSDIHYSTATNDCWYEFAGTMVSSC